MSVLNTIYRIMLPGIVFQSILVGGGYASGREIAEFVVSYGSNDINVIVVVALGFFLLFFLAMEIARTKNVFNYHDWSKELLFGATWATYIFEFLFVSIALVAIAVVFAASADFVEKQLNIYNELGLVIVTFVVAFLIYLGRHAIEKTKVFGTVILYGLLVVIFAAILLPSSTLESSKAVVTAKQGWFLSGITYISYNAIAITACLFAFTHIRNRKESLIAGVVATLLALIPMFVIRDILLRSDQSVIEASSPLNVFLLSHGDKWVIALYGLALVITLIETATGLIHAIVTRIIKTTDNIARSSADKTKSVGVALAVIGLSIALSKFGLINLVAKGYGYLAWGFFLIFVIPLLIWPARRLFNNPFNDKNN